MASIPVGPNGSFTLVVTAEHLANRFKDATLPPGLATPVMIMAMQNAALKAIKPFLKERGECGGNPHRRASFGGNASRQADRRGSAGNQGRWSRIEFKIEATEGVAPIGTGTHERMVIDMVRFVERLKQNSA